MASQPSSLEEQKLDIEVKKLEHEERRVRVEERKARQGFWTRLGVVVPLLVAGVAFGGTWWSQHQESRDKIELQELQAKDGFELKVVEIVMDTRGPFGTRNRANAIQQLFPDRLREDFASSFDPEQASDRKTYNRDQRVASKKELIALLVAHPDQRDQILRTWRQMFPGDEWARGLR